MTTESNRDAAEALWGDSPVLALLRLPIPVEGMGPLLDTMRIIYGEPVHMESRGDFLVILKQSGHPEEESDS